MAERRTIARPYAKAVFEIADQSKTYEKWSQILKLLAMVSENTQMHALLRDKTIPWQEMADFFLSIFGKELDEVARDFVLVLASYKRLEVLPEIRSLYEAMRAERENTIRVQFISSVVLDEWQRKEFKSFLEKYFSRTVKMEFELDNNLIGGFIARAENDVMDGSIRAQLTNLKETMGD